MSSRRVVQKYGGSSVADLAGLQRVSERIVATRNEGLDVVVVVSAMGNTTNELLNLARAVSKAPGRRELDMLVSVGERISMTLLSMSIHNLGVPARSFTGSQSGIITDEAHNQARVVAVKPGRIEQALAEGCVAIVAGFQGVSRDREVTTLGRGGSDTTAVALAAALGAQWCEICSDVPGVFTADPRVVPEAICLENMSLEEALALSRNGARVLHDEAIAYAMREGIELLASATQSPGPGTRIQVGPLPARVVGITHDQALELFEADDSRVLLDALHLAGAPLRSVDDRRVLVDSRNWPDRQAFTPPEGCVSRGAVAVVAAVGGGMDSHLSLAREGIACLEASRIALRGWFSSELAVKWIVSVDDAEAAARALHALWISP